MTTPWNPAGTATTTSEPPAGQQQAWQQAPQSRPFPAPQGEVPFGSQPSFGGQPGFAGQQGFGGQPGFAAQSGFGPGGIPPQGPGFGGPGFPGGPAPKKNTTLIISLVVAAVLLIGGGVTAFFLLKKDDTTPTAGPVVPTNATMPSVETPANPTKSTPTGQDDPVDDPQDDPVDDPKNNPATPTTSPSPTSEENDPVEQGEMGGGDMATAEGLVENWLVFVNEGDAEAASHLICAAEQQDFIDGFEGVTTPANQLEAVDMQWDGDNIALTLGAVGDTTGESQLNLTMWPTDTGWFLICSNPLSKADLNW